eukprot:GDKJ01023772.1.p1 GENE.GDKJ01023772.1~~GDKJ01023772.1.p1  ORF type:complete len:621 (+),score=147.61 GDKJ01023772.1:55-1917(+)
MSGKSIEEILKSGDSMDIVEINADTIDFVLKAFVSKIRKNAEMRSLYDSNPEKFLPSEIELDEAIDKIKSIAASPEYLPYLVEQDTFKNLNQLLTHDNEDIVKSVLEALNDLTDADFVSCSPPEIIETLISSLSKISLPLKLATVVLPRFCSILSSSSEGSEAFNDATESITTALSICENLIELSGEVFCANDTFASEVFLKFIVNHSRSDSPTQGFSLFNRAYCCELMCMIMQSSPVAVELLSSKSALDRIFASILHYHKTFESSSSSSVASPLDVEVATNLLNCLQIGVVAAQMQTEEVTQESKIVEFRNSVMQCQGIQIMSRLLLCHSSLAPAVIKFMNAILETSFSAQEEKTVLKGDMVANTFIEANGIKISFGLLSVIGDGSSKSRSELSSFGSTLFTKISRSQTSYVDFAENIVGVIRGLVKCCSGDYLTRVQAKFLEKKGEKVDSLLSLRETFYEVVRNLRMERENAVKISELGLDSEDEEFLVECEAGIKIMHAVDEILMRLVDSGVELIRNRVFSKMDERGVLSSCASEIIEEAAKVVSRLPDLQQQSIRDDLCRLAVTFNQGARAYGLKYKGRKVEVEALLETTDEAGEAEEEKKTKRAKLVDEDGGSPV